MREKSYYVGLKIGNCFLKIICNIEKRRKFFKFKISDLFISFKGEVLYLSIFSVEILYCILGFVYFIVYRGIENLLWFYIW